VKPTATQIVLAYVGSIFLLLTVFRRPLGLADYWDWVFMAVCVVALIGLFFARKRQKAALAGTASGERPQPNTKIMWFSLVLIIVISLSSFFWLPYTGIAVSHIQLIIISITTCILSVTAYLIAWRRSHRSNKSLEPTAGRRDAQI
jgi:Na+/H+ antiporter NhaD/arsenite permease-like protein